jgi:hypothetical protein
MDTNAGPESADNMTDAAATQFPLEPALSTPEALRSPPQEIGGRDGPEPTRFGDWEKAGRCIDF